MPRLTHLTLAMATLFATAAVVSAQSAYPAGHSTNEAFSYQNQNGQKASPYDYEGNTQAGNQAYAAPQGQAYAAPQGQAYNAPQAQPYGEDEQYAQSGQYPQSAPAYNQQYPQSAPVAPAVDSGIEYPAPAVVAAPYPYPYYGGYPYGYYPYYGGVHIGLGFGYYGGYRGGYRGYVGGYRGGFRGPVGGGFHGSIGIRGRGFRR